MATRSTPFAQSYFHGAKAPLSPGDLIVTGHASNFGRGKAAAYVYLASTLDAAVWGAELALGEGPQRIYVVEPTGPLEDDPNVTDKKFAGNPTMSYRTRDPLIILGEVVGWAGHDQARLAAMRATVAEARRQGIEAIED